MLVRRSRALVKPNIAKVSKLGRTLSEKVTPASKGDKGDTECADIAPAVAVECSDHTQGIEPCTSEAVAVTVEDIPPAVNHEQPATCESDPVYEDHVDPLAPERRIAHVPVDYSKLLSPKSSDRCYSDYYEPTLPRPRKKFTGDEELDPKKMRMMDMIYWNPKKEKGMSRRHVETESVISQEKQPVTENVDSKTSKLAAPQVVIGPDGRLVLDEKSLVVTEIVNDESVWETIDEDRVSRKVTSLSFRNRMWRKGTSWTEKETELFYEILRCTGPDFGLMHEFFPTRARNELKTKFNREERNNWAKLKEVMGRPALLNDDLYERAAALQKEIAEEAFNKKMKKVKDVEKKVKETASKEKKVLTPEEEAARAEKERIRKQKKKVLTPEEEAARAEKERIRKQKKKLLTPEEKAARAEMARIKRQEKKAAEEEWDEDRANLVDEAAALIRELERESAEHDDEEDGDEVDEPVVEIRRSERNKKLSAKAQKLLDQTVKNSESGTRESEDGGEIRDEAFDGYDEESTSDTDSSDDDFGVMYYRKRQAPRVTKTAALIPRQTVGTVHSTTSVSGEPSTSSEETLIEPSTGASESGAALDCAEQDNQPCCSKDNGAPPPHVIEQSNQSCVSPDRGDDGDEPEATESSLTSPTPTLPLNPDQGSDLHRVKRSKSSLVSCSSKPEGSAKSPARKRLGEKAKPNIKVKKSKADSHRVETESIESASTVPSNLADSEVVNAVESEESNAKTSEPGSDSRNRPEPGAQVPKSQTVDEDLFKRTRPINRNRPKRPLPSRR